MAKAVTAEMLDISTPEDVVIRAEPRQPIADPTLGIPVTISPNGTPPHRLVFIGDSLTHGFQSGAIFKTNLSYPAMIAQALGWKGLRYPTYNSPGDGLPINLETVARRLSERFGDRLDWWQLLPALLDTRSFLDENEDYWERRSSAPATTNPINHNLAVYGWDLRNTLDRTAADAQRAIAATEFRDDFLNVTPQSANDLAALRVLNSARDASGTALSPLQAARVLGDEGSLETGEGEGIETLVILIGSNNALGSVLTFTVNWSGIGFDDMDINDQYTVWRPVDFQAELDLIVQAVRQIRARHVIWGTVPHVTIAPFAQGIGDKVRPDSRYFPYYTYPWIKAEDFNPQRQRHLTAAQARAIDSAIDQYNDAIAAAVRQGRQDGYDWYLFELVELLDRLAYRRYLSSPSACPDWWTPYELPPELAALTPVPNTRFFRSDRTGRTQGGLFSLDGIHPTTIGYGIMAQEVIKIMQRAGVAFPPGGQIDFQQLIGLDTLISQPPPIVSNLLNLAGWIDIRLGLTSSAVNQNI